MSPTSSRRSRVRLAVAALSATMAVSLLAACGGSDASTATGAKASSGPATITFWGWAKGTEDVVKAFNASHTDVKVNFEKIPSGIAGGYAKLTTAAKAGNAPDLFNVEYGALPDFVTQGHVADITSLVPDDLKSKYLPQATQLTTLAGKTWALPLDVAPQALFYRKDLFAKAGITPPATWDEFRAAGQKLKQRIPNSRIATFFPDDAGPLEAFAWQSGARWFGTSDDSWNVRINGQDGKRVVDYWQGLISDDLVRVMPSFSQQWTASLEKGETAAYVGAAWGGGVLKGTVADQAGKWAVAPVPSWDGKPASGMLGGTTFAVSKDSKNAKAALTFAEWATTTPEGIKARIASGTSSMFPASPALVPTARSAFKVDFYGGQDIYGLFTEAAKSIRPDWQWGPAMGTTNTALADSFGKLAQGGTLSAAVDSAQKATTAELANRGIKVAQ
ncbi:sugar ABC transporter substrate-binding protein [Kribbella ginsengisoli]|uniref:Sugar ABC transporter substrate-binding protein n=1 Tax=Kribbella ginsengisoli TaxID=363865 RepID=A0ABP6WCF3_9ACTN